MPTTGTVPNNRAWATGSIASGAAQSNDINLMGYRPAALDFSSGWDAANAMTFRVSQNATDWFDLYNASGEVFTVASGKLTSSTSRCIVPHTEMALAMAAHQWLRVVSAANLTTGVSFTVALVPF